MFSLTENVVYQKHRAKAQPNEVSILLYCLSSGQWAIASNSIYSIDGNAVKTDSETWVRSVERDLTDPTMVKQWRFRFGEERFAIDGLVEYISQRAELVVSSDFDEVCRAHHPFVPASFHLIVPTS